MVNKTGKRKERKTPKKDGKKETKVQLKGTKKVNNDAMKKETQKRPKNGLQDRIKKNLKKNIEKSKEERYANVGRKPLFDPAYHIPLAVGLARGGATVEQIAKLMNKARCTVYRWKEEYPEFALALEGGHRGYIQGIVNKLTQRAEGYEAIEESVEYERQEVEEANPGDPDHPIVRIVEVPVKRKVTRKQVAPDVNAIMQILTNKDGENWKNKQSVDVEGKMGITDENQRELASELVKIPGVRDAIIKRFRESTPGGNSQG
jgi:hypothetical protein